MKLTRQYFQELSPPQPARYRFIARKESYHGTTLGALSTGGHVARRALYTPMLMTNISHVSACNAYRGIKDGESTSDYVARLAQELDDEFQRLGPETVCAFVAEPVVGAVRLYPFSMINLTLSGARLRSRRTRLLRRHESRLRQIRRTPDPG
jgi:adenosylmethionine-8-amino-7-oxononanoate aminotransferase